MTSAALFDAASTIGGMAMLAVGVAMLCKGIWDMVHHDTARIGTQSGLSGALFPSRPRLGLSAGVPGEARAAEH
jgi:hypothetical protein